MRESISPSAPGLLSVPLSDARVADLLASDRSQVMQLVEKAYSLFHLGQAIEVAPSYLRPPHDPSARIIAKPACVYGDEPIAGLKWISSFPRNLALDIPRASGLLILNDIQTGLPTACMEVGAISAHRTAASAVLGLKRLHRRQQSARNISLIGTGVIAWQIVEYLVHDGWTPSCWVLHDLDRVRADAFAARLKGLTPQADVMLAGDAQQAMTQSDVVVFATSAGTPYLDGPPLRPEQTVLHISLRDLGVPLVAQASNFVDSAELAFTHQTSLHLAESALGHRQFLAGEIGSVLEGVRPAGKPVVYSPFGMAILDLVVGHWVHQTLTLTPAGER